MEKKPTTDQDLVKDKKAHRGYNESNPAQPEAPFKADSMEKEGDSETSDTAPKTSSDPKKES
jgi:hypothetical protein